MPRIAVAVLMACMSTVATAKDLTSGEFRNTAHTIEKGEVALHPLFLPGGVGVTDHVDVKFAGAVAVLAAPYLSVEVAPIQNESFALSVQPHGTASWQFLHWTVGGDMHFTKGLGGHRLNLTAGYARRKHSHTELLPPSSRETRELVSRSWNTIPLNVGIDLVTSESTTFRLVGTTDLLSFDDSTRPPEATVSLNWNQGFGETFRFSAGLAAYTGEHPLARLPIVVDTLPELSVFGTPTVEMWWKL